MASPQSNQNPVPYKVGSWLNPFVISSMTRDDDDVVNKPTPQDLVLAELRHIGDTKDYYRDSDGGRRTAVHDKELGGGAVLRRGNLLAPFIPHLFGRGRHGFSATDNIIVAKNNSGSEIQSGDILVADDYDTTGQFVIAVQATQDNDVSALVARERVVSGKLGLFYNCGICKVNTENADDVKPGDPIGIKANNFHAYPGYVSLGHVIALDSSTDDVYARIGASQMFQLVKIVSGDNPYTVTVLNGDESTASYNFTNITNLLEDAGAGTMEADDEALLVWFMYGGSTYKYLIGKTAAPTTYVDVATVASGSNPYTMTRGLTGSGDVSVTNVGEATSNGYLQVGDAAVIVSDGSSWKCAVSPARWS